MTGRVFQKIPAGALFNNKWVKGVSFWRNCGAASVGEWNTKIWFINGVDNVNWPPYRDWKADVSSVSPSSEQICSDEGLTLETSAFQSLYSGQFTLSTPLINQIFVLYLIVHRGSVAKVVLVVQRAWRHKTTAQVPKWLSSPCWCYNTRTPLTDFREWSVGYGKYIN